MAAHETQTTTAKHYTSTPENVEILAGYRVVVIYQTSDALDRILGRKS
jgi:hypothetical protein